MLCGFFMFFSFVTLNLSAQQSEKPNPNVKEIIFVFKTHFDNGYTNMAESVINKYCIDQSFRVWVLSC